ncbi:kinase-like protein [Obba rivulosa]|uniref:Kinase-like protein n=1 Tax=Obba rivulosa TaxID=1052685 RepID=A0A8E2AMB6_9APHY|nr:kinase-like protein [Obba rivulosa]
MSTALDLIRLTDTQSALPCVPCVINFIDDISRELDDRDSSPPQLYDVLRKLCEATGTLPLSCAISPKKLQVDPAIGPVASGGFAVVRKGKHQGSDVAVKEIQYMWRVSRTSGETNAYRKYIFREIFILRYIRHRNIIRFRGIVLQPSALCIMYDWMCWGRVSDFLKANPLANRVKLLLDLATGMEYLHRNGVVHGDSKSANVLVDDEQVARIADFGLGAFTYENKCITTTTLAGTVRWTAPELLDPESYGVQPVRTPQSDVYAFAMTAWEIFAENVPFHEVPHDTAVILRVGRGVRPDRPVGRAAVGLSDPLWDLISHCWDGDWRNRTSSAEIVECLKSELRLVPP